MENDNAQAPRLNLLPILLIGLILFVLFKVDFKSAVESPQFQKNISYVTNAFTGVFVKYQSKAKDLFFKNGSFVPSVQITVPGVSGAPTPSSNSSQN